ncbi:thioesterase II family protein [Streptomyces sp. NPDC058001]|uniref:thioesterase II family protein n=1 Tax=Streptomyces sp. NPDC058001 TaxID=3346300 RepID=UPI0036F08872
MGENAVESRWFPSHRGRPDAGVQLFCLPAAGMGASAYREWQAALGPGVEVIAVQLPGRESRFGEQPLSTVDLIVERLTGPLLERADRPFALFGHSMGALLSFEIAHEAVRRGRPPVRLIVSGLEAAHDRTQVRGTAHELSESELLEYVLKLGGIPPEGHEYPELVSLFLPTLRADLAVGETYRYRARPPLPVPITALAGRDDPMVDHRRFAAWSQLTRTGARTHLLPGEHFYLDAERQAVLDIIRSALR